MQTTGKYQGAIAELRAQRQKIEAAIEALESLDQYQLPAETVPQPTKRAARKPKVRNKTVVPAKSQRKRADGAPSTHDLVVEVLKSGRKRPGAVIAALKDKASKASIYTMLSYMHVHGETQKNDDQTYSLVDRS